MNAARGPCDTDVVIELKSVTKRYKDVIAVDDVSLDIHRGEFVGLLGPNGAGKTTLVEMIQGLSIPESGTIRILNRVWPKNESYLRNRLSGVLQQPLFINKLRVIETLDLFGSFYGRGRTRSDEVLEMVDLVVKRKALVETLSGGQRQRLALALALLNEPEIVILDEPTTGLDPRARRDTWEILRKLNKESRSTLILTTHYMQEAEFLCERICMVHKGRVLADGTLVELLRTYGGGDVVEYRLRGTPVCDDLRGRDDVVSYHFDSSSFRARVLVHDAVEFTRGLYDAAKKRGGAIEDLAIRRYNLDDMFLSLAGRQFDE